MRRRSLLIAMLLSPAASAPAQDASQAREGAVKLETVATGIAHPWSLAFLPDGRMLVTEREGRLRMVSKDGVVSEPVSGLPEVDAVGQGGLLGVALHPAFETNRLIYMSFAEARDGGNCTSVMRGRLSDDLRQLDDARVIFQQKPAFSGSQHFGSRLVFDRTGALFVTMGDRNHLRPLVQRGDTHIGKIVRITDDGGVPADNPKVAGWLPEIWSMGHRNVQGATLHPETGVFWTVEHGSRGGDELNHPEGGKNYGWPVISYGREYSGAKIGEGTSMEGMEQPVHYWDPSIAPSGMAFYTGDKLPEWNGDLFVGSLVQQHLARLTLEAGRVVNEERLFEGPDGYLYLLTDEEDGKLLRVVPAR